MNFNVMIVCWVIICGYFFVVNSESTDFTLSEITVGSVDLAGCKVPVLNPCGIPLMTLTEISTQLLSACLYAEIPLFSPTPDIPINA